ncbi:HAMP domain-containing histidine kinase [Campylobacter sp. RM12920]|uniref:histidine kinase n=1 Tax=Campylobacter californiensis TaxID=1032243 RepID=A0ABD4JJA3_9BACT|nr:HAMP domain-containing histidine kinase [Campylobacter sp. RM12919]MBE2988590.1 HAMP domain-containing histidine kinase [Campylobacter sp. RM12920]
MLKIFALFTVFLAVLFGSFWFILGEIFWQKVYILLFVGIFLTMLFAFIVFELLSLQSIRVREVLDKKQTKLKRQSAKIRLRNYQLEGLLGGISHEFKNPLAIIKTSAQTIKGGENLDQAIRDKFIDKIIKNSDKLDKIINRLRIGFGENLVLNLSLVELSKLCSQVSEDLASKYQNQSIVISGSAYVKADADMIYQVLFNLCENALKYSQNDVFVEILQDRVLVKDSGSGIDDDEIKLITKKFYKSGEKNWNSSLGLGLYIVKYILKLHKFEFLVSSQIGVGSEFGFKFRD